MIVSVFTTESHKQNLRYDLKIDELLDYGHVFKFHIKAISIFKPHTLFDISIFSSIPFRDHSGS